jgi:FkbM family methyltransferase
VVDAGANEGLYAIAVCKANPDVSVYCVEPNPISLARLRKNLELNNLLQRCHIIPAALWSHPGRQKLKYLPFVTTNASLQGVSAKSRWLLTPTVRSVIVEATTLDGLLELFHLTEVAILKIDIEGSEVEALRGATQTLMKTKRVVIEYHSDLLRQEAIEIMENDKHFQLKHETRDKVHATQSCGNLYFWRNEAE